MKSVVRIQGQGKVKDVGLRGLATLPVPESVDTTVALIQALIPLGLTAVAEALKAEVTALAGERYRRTGGLLGFVQTRTENERVCTAFLWGLLERGLRAEQGPLWIIDGAKGLRKAPGGLRLAGAGAALSAAQARECGGLSPDGPAGRVAAEAPGSLRAAERPRGEGGPPPAPAGAPPPQRLRGHEPGRGAR